MTPADLLLAAAALPVGTAASLAHFASLEATTRALVGGERRARAIVLTVLRFGMTGGVLVMAAHLGALPLLSAAAGFALGRAVVLRRGRQV